MTRASRRIEISFERERAALRALSALLPRVPRHAHIADASDAHEPARLVKAATYLAELSNAYGPLPTTPLDARTPRVDTLLVDASALAELARGNPFARAHVALAVGSLANIIVPATALLDPTLARIADAVGDVLPIDAAIARTAADIMARARLALPFEALCVACVSHATTAGILTKAAGVGALVRAVERPDLHVFSL